MLPTVPQVQREIREIRVTREQQAPLVRQVYKVLQALPVPQAPKEQQGF
jgi:hypothetical protein